MKHILFVLAIALTVLTVDSCATPHHTAQIVHNIRSDTIYLNTLQYDSIYISKDRVTDRSRDTVYIKDVSIEYRYRLLRDTIRITQHDSIPYEVTITETREIMRPLTWFDHLTRACFWLFVGFLVFGLIRIYRTKITN